MQSKTFRISGIQLFSCWKLLCQDPWWKTWRIKVYYWPLPAGYYHCRRSYSKLALLLLSSLFSHGGIDCTSAVVKTSMSCLLTTFCMSPIEIKIRPLSHFSPNWTDTNSIFLALPSRLFHHLRPQPQNITLEFSESVTQEPWAHYYVFCDLLQFPSNIAAAFILFQKLVCKTDIFSGSVQHF